MGRSFRGNPIQFRPQFQAAKALEGVTPPRAVVDPLPHFLAELTVAGNADTGLLLETNNLGDRAGEAFLVGGRIDRLSGLAPAGEFNPVIPPRQAAPISPLD